MEKKRELDRLESELNCKWRELDEADEKVIRIFKEWGEEIRRVSINGEAIKKLSEKYIPLLEEAQRKDRETYGAMRMAQDAFDETLNEELEKIKELEKQI